MHEDFWKLIIYPRTSSQSIFLKAKKINYLDQPVK